MVPSVLLNIHNDLCHPGVTKMLHYIKTKNLPYSTDEVRRVVKECKICAKVKPQFCKLDDEKLIKATAPMQRLSLDFKGPLPSISNNKYFLTVVDEYSRMPFAFPCSNINSSTVIKCLVDLFSILGYPDYIHSDRGASFMSKELKDVLFTRDIATSKTTPYHPTGNAQCEKYNGIIWKSIQLALMTQELPTSHWESVLCEALHSIRSTLCTSINTTPHERFFTFQRRSSVGKSIPTGLIVPGKALLRRFVRKNKTDPLVDEVDIIDINPTYANIRYPDGRESTVSLKDLAPLPQDNHMNVQNNEGVNDPITDMCITNNHEGDIVKGNSCIPVIEVPTDSNSVSVPTAQNNNSVNGRGSSDSNTQALDTVNVDIMVEDISTSMPQPVEHLRRSGRANIGVAPVRYGHD